MTQRRPAGPSQAADRAAVRPIPKRRRTAHRADATPAAAPDPFASAVVVACLPVLLDAFLGELLDRVLRTRSKRRRPPPLKR